MSDVPPEQRRSRLGWILTTEPTTTPAGTHDHQLKNTPVGMAFLGIVLLFLVNVGLVAYVIIAKQSRDAAQEQIQREIRDSWCQALDGFPQDSVFLDPLRERYHCGPGMPLDSFSPDIQEQFSPAPQPTPQPPAPVQQPAPVPAPVPSAEPPAEPPPPDDPDPLPGGSDGPMTPAEPPPLSPPSQVRHLVCDLLPVCPEGDR